MSLRVLLHVPACRGDMELSHQCRGSCQSPYLLASRASFDKMGRACPLPSAIPGVGEVLHGRWPGPGTRGAWGPFNERNHGGRNKTFLFTHNVAGLGFAGGQETVALPLDLPPALSPGVQRS